MDADRARRRKIFEGLASTFGRIVPASFVQNPNLPGVDRIHPLIEGNHEASLVRYALSIASMIKNFNDQTHHPDKTWWMHYSPKAGGINLAANAALIRCRPIPAAARSQASQQ
jgi:hypothetical protein